MADLKHMTTNEMSAILGMTARNLRHLVDDGIVPCTREGRSLSFDALEVVPTYISHVSNSSKSKTESMAQLEKQRLEEDVRLKRAKAEEAELELEELRGNLHRSSDVEEAINGLVYSVRSNLTALPGRLANDAYGAKSEAEVSQIVKREIELVMRDLSNYLYDPDVFARLVRERHGWDGNTGFESDCSEVV